MGLTSRARARGRLAMTAVSIWTVSWALGCGGTDGDSTASNAADARAAKGAVRELRDAFSAGDLDRICARMTPQARRQAGLVAHGKPEQCARDLREAFAVIDAGEGWRDTATKIGGVEVEVDAATASLTVAGRPHVDVPLARDGAWRLDSFFGTPPPRALAAANAVRRGGFPPAGGKPVEVADGRGSLCFPTFVDDFPTIAGGCELTLSTSRAAVDIATVFGDFKFGDCSFGYRTYSDAAGRTWSDQISFSAPRNNGCADIRACRDEKGVQVPWRGRIRDDGRGGFVHTTQACLDTCIGYYVGTFETRMEQRGGRWTATVDSGIGQSGLSVKGDLELESAGLRIAPAD